MCASAGCGVLGYHCVSVRAMRAGVIALISGIVHVTGEDDTDDLGIDGVSHCHSNVTRIHHRSDGNEES